MTYYQGYGTTYQNQAWPHGCQCQHERCRVPGCQYQVRASQPTACAPLLARQQPHLVVLRPHDDWPEESDCCGDAFCRCVDWLLTVIVLGVRGVKKLLLGDAASKQSRMRDRQRLYEEL
ncbi:uncharacterized protein LOC131672507 [Phymastichus coffea]|uniref:uncharacterized protein LOC131672507 n=1 Tax=Phymastichus coffea TaxID=108790 RepID=UPI00273C861A|nr:uncharacterized protein LOC131672507 [Phymastichus coffea]